MRKKILITGGGGDIAKAIKKNCKNFEIDSPGRMELDVSDQKSIDQFIRDKKYDILINNAGYISPAALADHELDKEIKTIDVNLMGVIRVSLAVHKKNPDGLIIINIGSSAGTKPRGTWGAYCASKAALIMLTACWADEGISAYCLSPGRTATKMRHDLFGEEDNSTLMSADDFAKVVLATIEGKHQPGVNLDINLNNVGSYI